MKRRIQTQKPDEETRRRNPDKPPLEPPPKPPLEPPPKPTTFPPPPPSLSRSSVANPTNYPTGSSVCLISLSHLLSRSCWVGSFLTPFGDSAVAAIRIRSVYCHLRLGSAEISEVQAQKDDWGVRERGSRQQTLEVHFCRPVFIFAGTVRGGRTVRAL